MSAIAGLFRLDRAQVAAEDLARMHEALVDHGRDGGDTWCLGGIGLAQRQMAVCPEDRFERQPLAFAQGRYRLVADMRLDNRPELIAALGILRTECGNLPDSALLALAWERWGAAAPERLVGDYAFAVWDETTHRLYLARSPLGKRPLYYHADGRRFAFATMPQGLYALPRVPRVLTLGRAEPADPRQSPYHGLRHVLPGHLLRVWGDGQDERAFWRLDLNRRLKLRNDREYEEAFRERLDTVVAGMLRDGSDLGVMMSGGLDSTAVAATAARRLMPAGLQLATYTQVPPAGFVDHLPAYYCADESAFVRAVASMHPNMRPHWIVARGHPLEGLETFFEAALHSFQNLTNWSWMRSVYTMAAAHGTRVLLTGGNGNLTFSWSGAGLLPELVRRGAWRQAWREARAVAAAAQPPGAAWRVLVGQGLRPLWVGNRPTNPPRAPDGGGFNAWRRGLDTSLELPLPVGDGSTRRWRYAALHPEGAANYSAALQALFGVQDRDPSSDIRMIAFCFAVPEAQWLWRGIPRALLRRALTDRLPALVLDNRRRGYQAAEWWEGILPRGAQFTADLDTISTSATVREFIDLPRLGRLIARLSEQRPDADPMTLALYQWVLLEGLAMGRFLAWYESRWRGDIVR